MFWKNLRKWILWKISMIDGKDCKLMYRQIAEEKPFDPTPYVIAFQHHKHPTKTQKLVLIRMSLRVHEHILRIKTKTNKVPHKQVNGIALQHTKNNVISLQRRSFLWWSWFRWTNRSDSKSSITSNCLIYATIALKVDEDKIRWKGKTGIIDYTTKRGWRFSQTSQFPWNSKVSMNRQIAEEKPFDL